MRSGKAAKAAAAGATPAARPGAKPATRLGAKPVIVSGAKPVGLHPVHGASHPVTSARGVARVPAQPMPLPKAATFQPAAGDPIPADVRAKF
jgi:translation initiation factor IF-2